MFCLRSWVPLLIFLTNASPIYVVLFLLGNYALSRPCVYCSILLFVLVFSLFDFHADWFEPRWHGSFSSSLSGPAASALAHGNGSLSDAVLETAGFALSAINGTGGSLMSAALGSMRDALAGGDIGATCTSSPLAGGSGNSTFEWIRGVLERRQFRIPCVDVLVRL